MFLFDPTRLFFFENWSAYTLICFYSFIWYLRVFHSIKNNFDSMKQINSAKSRHPTKRLFQCTSIWNKVPNPWCPILANHLSSVDPSSVVSSNVSNLYTIPSVYPYQKWRPQRPRGKSSNLSGPCHHLLLHILLWSHQLWQTRQPWSELYSC